jgi:hypothetical protein
MAGSTLGTWAHGCLGAACAALTGGCYGDESYDQSWSCGVVSHGWFHTEDVGTWLPGGACESLIGGRHGDESCSCIVVTHPVKHMLVAVVAVATVRLYRRDICMHMLVVVVAAATVRLLQA